MRCFKCQGFGHLQSSCPNRRIVTLKEAVDWKDELVDAEGQGDQAFGSHEEDEGIEEFEAPPYCTNLMLRTLPDADEMEQGIHHSDMHLLIGKHLPEPEGSSQPEGRSPTPSDGPLTDVTTDPSSETEATEASRRITLQGPNGSNWQAEISETINGNFLTAGGSNIVEDHSLKDHEFLPFSYNRIMHFNVMILNTDASERQDLFEMKKAKIPTCSPLTPSTYPYVPPQDWQKVPGFYERIDWVALNEKFGLPSTESSFGFLPPGSVSNFRSFGLYSPSVKYLRLSAFGPHTFDLSPGEFSFSRTFCADREGWSARDNARRLMKKLLIEERKKGEQDHESVRTRVRSGFKEEPPPSVPFGPRHIRSITFGSVALSYLRISTASDISLRSPVFDHLRLTPGDCAPPTSNLTPCFNGDGRAELRTIPSKGEEMMRIWNMAPGNPHIMLGKDGFETLPFKTLCSAGFFYVRSYSEEHPSRRSVASSISLAFGFGHLPSVISSFGCVLPSSAKLSLLSAKSSAFCLRPTFGFGFSRHRHLVI